MGGMGIQGPKVQQQQGLWPGCGSNPARVCGPCGDFFVAAMTLYRHPAIGHSKDQVRQSERCKPELGT